MDDIVELTEDEAAEYTGKKCFKVGEKVFHRKNCKHNKMVDGIYEFDGINLQVTQAELNRHRDLMREIENQITEQRGTRFGRFLRRLRR